MKILLTGASGFLGSHLIEELVKQQSLSLRVTYPPGEDLGKIDSLFLIDGLDLESQPLDLQDRSAVAEALDGCQMLFHTQHFFSFDRKHRQRLYAENHLATKNLMELALRAGVEKVIYTSGIETLAVPEHGELATERDGALYEELTSDFEKSRYLAEREVLRLRHEGLPAIILHPTLAVGTRERQSTAFGRFLRDYLAKKIHFYLDTGLNLVSIQDVAKGHILAAKRGRIGAHYILGGKNFYLLELLKKLEALTKIPVPRIALPNGMAQALDWMLGNRRQALIRRLRRPLFFDSRLAHQELGMPESNIEKDLEAQLREMQNIQRKA